MFTHRFPHIAKVFESGRQKQLHLGLQVSITTPQQEFDLAFGEAAPDRPLVVEDSLCWLSAGKPLTAVVIMQLEAAGSLSVHDRLTKYLPEFAGDDDRRAQVCLHHLLTHTAPLREVVTGWPNAPAETILEALCTAPLQADWPPGERAAYLPFASWFLLGEVIQRVTRQSFTDVVTQQILTPLEMRHTRCVPSAENTGDRSDDEPFLYDRQQGALVTSEYTRRLQARVPSPGSSFRGPARELCRFYAALLSDLAGRTQLLLTSAQVAAMTQRRRVDLFDETFQHKIDFGYGVIIDSNHYGAATVPYGFGANCSPNTFGHGGSQSSIGFADPERQRSVVLIANGRPGEGQHQRRFRELLSALEQDLNELE